MKFLRSIINENYTYFGMEVTDDTFDLMKNSMVKRMDNALGKKAPQHIKDEIMAAKTPQELEKLLLKHIKTAEAKNK